MTLIAGKNAKKKKISSPAPKSDGGAHAYNCSETDRRVWSYNGVAGMLNIRNVAYITDGRC